ncbi:AAA family ATPase [Desulfonema limicola]|uniref:Replication-associated recombination protein A n=1 Tax=Desulfonema limicola TaxID=45656 RepID=A0A975GIT0_9BACT|nr:replication-associated recombination protein A [Desulfonema limicola]QTA82905.1 AAA family ATPase [Desulfonema limicola]
MDLFEYHTENTFQNQKPLAERMRPDNIQSFMGQEHAVSRGSIIRHAVENDKIFSMILWGPPGCGKTTLARIIAAETASCFIHFSAVLSGVKDIRTVIEEAKKQQNIYQKKTILFVDEIHSFNKTQQNAFLHHVESGLITLIGATTENPSFEIIAPLLSRTRVITLTRLSRDAVSSIIQTALTDQEKGLGIFNLSLSDKALNHLIRMADGDARAALNSLEISAQLAISKGIKQIGLEIVENAVQKQSLRYDKDGEEHYNLISAFHKSMRGSDPDAALYWLSRMLTAGEKPLYIARRMVRFASEDVGNADPFALRIALDSVDSYQLLGSPEGELALAQAAVYLATAPKSNAVYAAFGNVKNLVKSTGSLPVPFHIRNAPTKLMKDTGYGKGYKYAHDYKDGYVPQEYMPEELKGRYFYFPQDQGYENTIRQRLETWRNIKNKIMQ